MKNTTHTPGPWKANNMLVMHTVANNADFNGRQLVICNCDYQQTLAGGSKQSNARLIAAAPELLEACKAVALWLIAPATDPKTILEMNLKVRAAISKAEGNA